MMPSIDRLRRAAKALRRDAGAGEADAVARVRAVLPEAGSLRHADALHVIAREQGFASWPKLKFAVEAAAMDRKARAARLRTALYYGQTWVVEALLAETPGLARDDVGLICATYDIAALRDVLARDPAAATRAVGPRRPILHLAYSQHFKGAGDATDMIATAELLLSHGADVNDSYPAESGSPHNLSALYGALGHAGNLRLAEWLLDHGADPNDNESLYHATELGHLDGVRLLLRHGVRIAGTNALPRMLDFDDLDGVRLLLEAGADPNEGIAGHPSGQPATVIPALHQAARRGCSAEIAALLLAHGADGRPPYRGHSAYALARMHGNRPVARALEAAGQATPLTATERALAAAADGAAAERVDPATLTGEARRILGRIAGSGGTRAHLARLVAAGIDPDWTDEMGMPAIHIAGWEGRADLVDYLLGFDPDLERKNDYGGDLMGTIIHGAEFCPARTDRDHHGCARAVLEAGARLHRSEIVHCGVEELADWLAAWADAHPNRVVEDA